MNTNLNNPTSAEALAANFKVSELEPRLENGWSVTNHEEPEHETGGTGKQ